MAMNWQIGKARCRSDEYEAEIGIVDETGFYGRYRHIPFGSNWSSAKWTLEGKMLTGPSEGSDLFPPRLTLEEAARECERLRRARLNATDSYDDAMLAALQHYEKMKAEGRV